MPIPKPPLVIGIAGGSGSGKTTAAEIILEKVGRKRIAYLQHDSYYRELTNLPLNQRAAINFDHPDSLENELMKEHILSLKEWKSIEVPVYDFTTHSRTSESVHVEPRRVILVEGILIFAEPELRPLFDVKIFVDTDSDIRFIRRLRRDIEERGRTTDMVVKQYLTTVRPMHLDFVEPSKRYADVVIPEGGLNEVAMDMIIARIESLLKEETSK
ncbi:MAG: uridine kinase [Anaerolineaceae bacterium]|nr:uridine kinase [Anaerolineaceae bacterium]